ncbi:hypothetical protein HYH03_005000 [Edaphochlamys debaryana]|uniref:Sulphur transport domain-containing protein n=1 Tax=Edaphochlamys debaryana TaxID=47281 RepID=A0A835Y6B7_9CHLO|nr:hypothetical protein HYH03_005000 [Edaphochlamys debaryana]|eukprot:KAG2496995.1 hypothetical protein HYH03_005000 [Edaphochlamys debaryana]
MALARRLVQRGAPALLNLTYAVPSVQRRGPGGASSGDGYTLLSFTPAHAALGGLLLGLAAAGKLLTTGRILGISGAVKGLVTGDTAGWRFAFLAGLGLGGVLLTGLLPSAFEAIPASFPMWRATLAGLLVGLGAALGNGCTSGHGICGSARLSLALPSLPELQLAATIAAVGVATFSLLSSAAAKLSRPSAASLAVADLTVLSKSAATPSTPSSAPVARSQSGPQQPSSVKALEWAAEATAGTVFALGLGLSGMMHPSKVAGFLSVTSPAWDLSLPFVMGSAVLVSLLAFQGVLRGGLISRPACCPKFQLPTSSVIDPKLIAGGILFGAGWGLAGMCPGPALVAAVSGDPAVLAYLGGMVGGFLLESRVGQMVAEAQRRAAKQGAERA